MKKRNVILSFDYELFLGSKSGTVAKCLIEPTEKVQAILKKHNARGIFFIDTLGIEKMKQQSSMLKDVGLIERQLISLLNDGHYIFPHLHPHWLDAKFLTDINQFDLSDLSNYSIASLKDEQIEIVFDRSVKYITGLGIRNSLIGYRAGGWCIQPFHRFKKSFVANSISFDFSALPGYINPDPQQRFDFSCISEELPYRFEHEIEKKSINGQFVEFPISTTKLRRLEIVGDRIWRKFLWKTGDRGYGDGISAKTVKLKSKKLNHEMISIELLTYPKYLNYKNFIKSNTYMHWISHPKMFTKHGLKLFSRFLDFANTNYITEFDFIKMTPNTM